MHERTTALETLLAMRGAAVRFTDERCPPRSAVREAIDEEDQEASASSASTLKDAAQDGQTNSLSSSECTIFCATAAPKDETVQQQQYVLLSRQFGSSPAASSSDDVMQAAHHPPQHHQHDADGIDEGTGGCNDDRGDDHAAEVHVAVKSSEEGKEGDGSRRANEDDHQKMAAGPPSIAEHRKALHLLDGPLFGREEEGRQLLVAYERCCCVDGSGGGGDSASPLFHTNTNNDPIQPEIVLLTGASGTGKTALVRRVLQPHAMKRGFFISGKFDQLRKSEQSSAIKQAFQEFIQQLCDNEANDENDHQARRREIRQIVEPIVFSEPLLLEMLPGLKQLLGMVEDGHSSGGGGKNNNNFEGHRMRRPSIDSRLSHGFCRLIRSICSPTRPLVLFLDDLQWADIPSLNLISALVNNESNSYDCCSGNYGLMIVGACRGNEVTLDHELSVTLRDMEEDGVCITDINLSNLDITAIHEMASTVLGIPYDRTTRLATFLYQQSGGNVLFVRQLLIALGDDGYFEMDPDTQHYAWEHDDDLVQSKVNQLGGVDGSGHSCRSRRSLDHECAVRLVTKRIRQQLSPRIQRILMLASCLGAEFEENTLEAVEQEPVRNLLLAAEQRDLVTKVVGTDTNKWRFVHDQIQQACYGLIPEDCRERTHLDIGWALCQSLSQDELEFHLNTIVDQLRLGADLIESQDDRDEVALLCLKAGEMATKASAFQTAADHLHFGIRLLGQRNWRDQHYLSVDIYMAAAEVEYCCGNFSVMDQLIAQVLENARSVEDRLRAYTTQVYSLGSRSELQQALDLGLEVLERDLGESFPRNSTKPRMAWLLAKTKRKLRKLSDDDILNLPAMTDSSKLMSMRLICIIAVYAYILSSPLFPMLAMRLVRMTVKHGVSTMSAPAFGFWATLLCNGLGDIPRGVRYARLSLALWESQNQSREWQSRVLVFSHGYCLTWADALCDQLEPLKLAHSAGLKSGDIESGLLSAVVYSMVALHVSVPLSQLADEISFLLREAIMLKQDISAHFLRPLIQVALNLQGRSRDPCVLTSDVMDESEAFTFARETKTSALYALLCSLKLKLCYLFGRSEEAERLSTLIDEECNTESFSSLQLGDLYLYQGLTALAGKSSRRRAVRLARLKLKKLKFIARLNPVTFQSQVLIVEGEIAAVKDEVFRAVRLFDEAAECARKDRVLGEIALAHERAAFALLRGACASSTANEYFEKARAAYSAWGADAKVEQINRALITDST